MVILICETCGEEFERSRGEVNRNSKLGRRTYCSLKCVGKDNNSHLDKWKSKCSELACRPDQRVPGANIVDEFSPFRFHMKCMRNKRTNGKKRQKCEVTLSDLKEQWDKQKGICPYTGWKLITLRSTAYTDQLPTTPDRASLDRIDSSKPYTKDNIQFVAMAAQFAKNKWTGEDLIEFCQAVVEHTQG